MIKTYFPEYMIFDIERAAKDIGPLRNSITRGEGNISGVIGEYAAANYLGVNLQNTKDYDLVFEGLKIDVKTKRTTVPPKEHYECSVANFNTMQDCDIYLFTRVKDAGAVWLLGWMFKDHFYDSATFHKKGQIDLDNNFKFKADCYNMPIKDLNTMEDLRSIA